MAGKRAYSTMVPSNYTNSETYKIGREAERVVKRWLEKSGYCVLPACMIENGGAPTLDGIDVKFVAPDLFIIKSGCSRWVEVKFKSTAPWYKKLKRRQHGISTRLMDNYRRVERESGIECWIAIIEGDHEQLLLYKLSALEIQRGMGKKNGEDDEPMDYWARDDCAEEPLSIHALGPPRPIPPCSPRTLRDPPCPLTVQRNLFNLGDW